MQRQVRILRIYGHRGAFALIAAVFLMLLLSIMLLKMLSYSAENAQQVVNDYLLEQAQLAAYGATEYAMLQVSADNRNVACTKNIVMTYPAGSVTGTKLFDINVNVQYVWAGTPPSGTDCDNTGVTGSAITVTTAEQNGSAYVDVTVTSDTANIGLTEPVRVHRKTLQKL